MGAMRRKISIFRFRDGDGAATIKKVGATATVATSISRFPQPALDVGPSFMTSLTSSAKRDSGPPQL
jgi:hypothetical protein